MLKLQVILKILQNLLHKLNKLMCYQSQKNNSDIYLFYFEIYRHINLYVSLL